MFPLPYNEITLYVTPEKRISSYQPKFIIMGKTRGVAAVAVVKVYKELPRPRLQVFKNRKIEESLFLVFQTPLCNLTHDTPFFPACS